MNKQLREFIAAQVQPTKEEFDNLIASHPVLNEFNELVQEGLKDEKDAITLGVSILIMENISLKNQLFTKLAEEQKHGRQIGKFTGFK